jgi:hypothetical protein
LIAVECDDLCAKDEALAMAAKLQKIAARLNRKIAVCFFVTEFECLFHHCLAEIAAHFPQLSIQLPEGNNLVAEDARDAKGTLGRYMAASSYKETRDQVRLVYASEVEKLLRVSRSFRHLADAVEKGLRTSPNSDSADSMDHLLGGGDDGAAE